MGGLGVRLARSGGPLLDAGVTLDSVAAHFYASVDDRPSWPVASQLARRRARRPDGRRERGRQLRGGRACSPPAATGEEPPRPAFSPALAVQRTGGSTTVLRRPGHAAAGRRHRAVVVIVQRGFGPLYLEQVGFGVIMRRRTRLGSFGLLHRRLGQPARADRGGRRPAASPTSSSVGRSALDPAAWAVDLAGFAVSADMAGLTLAGGLRKFPVAAGGVEYLGMLLGRFGVYGLSRVRRLRHGRRRRTTSSRRSSLFGAVNGPDRRAAGVLRHRHRRRLRHQPARWSSRPTCRSSATYPFIQALDPARAGRGDPMAELAGARRLLPARARHVLVRGRALVHLLRARRRHRRRRRRRSATASSIDLLGLARMALPRPQAALVSIELGLLARFSTSEGVLWVQAQLTDNSWLLYPRRAAHRRLRVRHLVQGAASAASSCSPSAATTRASTATATRRCRGSALRGASASAISHQGRAVLRAHLRGAHGRRPARGLGRASARPGPRSSFGGARHRLLRPVLARGHRLRVDLPPASRSTSGSARSRSRSRFGAGSRVEGPAVPRPGHVRRSGRSTSVSSSATSRRRPRGARRGTQFVAKYLEEAAPGVAHVLTAITGPGAVPPAGSASTGGARIARTAASASPFRVSARVRADRHQHRAGTRAVRGHGTMSDLPHRARGLGRADAPAGEAGVDAPADRPARRRPRRPDRPAHRPAAAARRVPDRHLGAAAGRRTTRRSRAVTCCPAVDRVLLAGGGDDRRTRPPGPRRRSSTGRSRRARRRPLPFVVEYTVDRHDRADRGFGHARRAGAAGRRRRHRCRSRPGCWPSRGGRSAADVAAWTGARSAAPLLGSLAEGPRRRHPPGRRRAGDPAGRRPVPPPPRPPTVGALLSAPAGAPPVDERPAGPAVTTVGDPSCASSCGTGPASRSPPGRGCRRGRPGAGPALCRPGCCASRCRLPTPSGPCSPTGTPPVTRTGRTGAQAVAGRGADPEAGAPGWRCWARTLTGTGTELTDGDVAVLRCPDAGRDRRRRRPALRPSSRGRVRVVAAAAGRRGRARHRAGALPGTVARRHRAGRAHRACVGDLPGRLSRPPAGEPAGSPACPRPTWATRSGSGPACVARSASRIPARGLAAAPAGWVAPGPRWSPASPPWSPPVRRSRGAGCSPSIRAAAARSTTSRSGSTAPAAGRPRTGGNGRRSSSPTAPAPSRSTRRASSRRTPFTVTAP